jgi:hypothetical protein
MPTSNIDDGVSLTVHLLLHPGLMPSSQGHWEQHIFGNQPAHSKLRWLCAALALILAGD